MEKRQSVQKYSKPTSNNSNPVNKNHQIRNIPLKKKGEKGDPNGKKTFLNDRYPEGSGPDTNLIEMLER